MRSAVVVVLLLPKLSSSTSEARKSRHSDVLACAVSRTLVDVHSAKASRVTCISGFAACMASRVCCVRVESLHMTRSGTQPLSASCRATCRNARDREHSRSAVCQPSNLHTLLLARARRPEPLWEQGSWGQVLCSRASEIRAIESAFVAA